MSGRPKMLTTSECGRRLGVSPGFVISEILAGRLKGLVLQRGGLRRIYRVSRAALEAYIRRYG